MPINNWHQCTRAREAVWYDIRLNLLGRRQSQRRVLGFGLRGERTSLLLQACHKEVQEYLTGKPDGEPAGSSTILIPNARASHFTYVRRLQRKPATGLHARGFIPLQPLPFHPKLLLC